MKKEELDKLKDKYWSGKSSLEEDQQLKNTSNDPYFNQLGKNEEGMDWGFDDFMAKVDQTPAIGTSHRVIKFNKKIIAISAIAASLVLGFYIFKPSINQEEPIQESKIANLDSHSLEQTIPNKMEEKPENLVAAVQENKKANRTAPVKPKQVNIPETDEIDVEQAYVEVNGVKIYDEEEALEITETAIHLAANNLKAGMKGVDKIKYLNIEI